MSPGSLGYRTCVKRTEPEIAQAQAAIVLALATPIHDPVLAISSPLICLVLPSISPVFVVFSFTSVVDLVIALQEDGYLMGLMDFYAKEVVWDGWVWSWPHHACS